MRASAAISGITAAPMPFVLAALLLGIPCASAEPLPITSYAGPCDASAAVALDAEHFVVGDDEHDILRIYRQAQARPVGQLDLSAFLATAEREESDIEGAAAVGTRIYWITSHGRNSKGKAQPSRHRLFATEMRDGNPPTLSHVGHPYTDLLREAAAAESLRAYRLDEAANLAAEAEGGFNIEGLASTPEGALLIGLRNPLRHGRALLVPLLNPDEVIEGGRARFGAPVELDLQQRGIRSIERVGDAYLIAAGPIADRGTFALYRWSGRAGEAATPVSLDLRDLRPEALFTIPGSNRIQLLSDDGGVRTGGVACKKLPLPSQTFRSLTVPYEK